MRILTLLATIAGLSLVGLGCAIAEPATRMTSQGKPPGSAETAILAWFTAGREISCMSPDGIDGPCGLDRVNGFQVFYDKAEQRAVVFATWSADTGNTVSLAVAQFSKNGGTWSFVRNLRSIYGQGPDTLDFTSTAASFTMTALMPNDARCCLTGTQRYDVDLQSGAVKEGPRLPGRSSVTVAKATQPVPRFDGNTYFHNGSTVLIDEKVGEIRYSDPKPSIRKTVQQGTVLFRGTFAKGGTITGTAYAFKLGCEPAAYPVTGYSKGSEIILRGAAPRRDPRSCAVIGVSAASAHATLRFEEYGDI